VVAVVQLSPSPPAPDRHLVVVRSTPVPCRTSATVSRSTFRRRRVVALAVVASVLLLLSLAVRGVLGGPSAAPESRSAGAVYVVQPGDTFWDIARTLRPDEDPRPVVARLVAAHRSPALIVGERIPIPDRA